MAEKWVGRYRYHLIGTIIIVICWAGLFQAISRNAAGDQQTHLSTERQLLQGEISSVINTYEAFGTYIFEQVIDTPEVAAIVEEAGRSGPEKQKTLRDALYARLKPDYERLLRYDFKQLQFHFANGDSFLRFNAPDLYGDNLFSLRDSVRIVNTEQRPVYGFEEGRVFNGYRMVFPLESHGKHIGSAEIAVSLNGAIKLLQDTYPANNLIYVLKREVVEGAVFTEQQSNYVASGISDQFLIDREVHEALFSTENGAGPYSQEAFIQQLQQGTRSHLGEDVPFSFTIANQGKEYLVQFLPILNVSQKPVGYFISSTLDDHGRVLQRKRNNEQLLVTLVFLLVELLLWVYLLERRNAQIRASVDVLTQISNRLKFTEAAEREMYRSIRYQKRLSILFFDLDDFKQVNDTYGHGVGDTVLKSMVASIKPLFRDSDILARWGGEEFIVLMPETDSASAMILAERIRVQVESNTQGIPRPVTVSLGVSERRPEDTRIEDIIKRADEAMYLAKVQGKNRCVSAEVGGLETQINKG